MSMMFKGVAFCKKLGELSTVYLSWFLRSLCHFMLSQGPPIRNGCEYLTPGIYSVDHGRLSGSESTDRPCEDEGDGVVA